MEIPEKYFYTIGEVSRITRTKSHILRYWESQFKLLRPARRYSGHRKYTQREIDLINKIRYLTFEKRYTLSGTKRELTRQTMTKSTQMDSNGKSIPTNLPLLKDLKKNTEECLHILGLSDPSKN